MPITFESIRDPYGIQTAGTILGNALMQRNLEALQNRRQMEMEERKEGRALAAEEKQLGRQKTNAGILQDALKVALDPSRSELEKLGALQQYIGQTGDSKSVSKLFDMLYQDHSEKQMMQQYGLGGNLEMPAEPNDIPGANIASRSDQELEMLALSRNPRVSGLAKDQLKKRADEKEAESTWAALKEAGVKGLPDKHIPGTPATTYRAIANTNKETFEPESDKIEAKRSADYADQIVRDYSAAITSDSRLKQNFIAAKSGQLPTPMMIKTLDTLDFPLSILGNPLAEAYEKNVNEYIKDVANYFPGQIRVAEIEPYMKTIPTLQNSDEGKLLILENQMLVNDIKKANYEAYKDILKENGGRKPKNLDVEILERTAEKRAEIGEKLVNNFEKAVQMTKYPTKKVKKGTMITPDVSLMYLNKFNGDRNAAMKAAAEDGYVY